MVCLTFIARWRHALLGLLSRDSVLATILTLPTSVCTSIGFSLVAKACLHWRVTAAFLPRFVAPTDAVTAPWAINPAETTLRELQLPRRFL